MKCQELGTLDTARTRQSGSDKLTGFRNHNGPFLHTHLVRSTCGAYVIYNSQRNGAESKSEVVKKKRDQKRSGAERSRRRGRGTAARRSSGRHRERGKDGWPSSGHGQDARRLPGLPLDPPRFVLSNGTR
ncbi:hypothetical protein ALC53_04193 [Atta colombica]|uniref:Uncharacterized protein n=1 Tax=Atta colombica TaxID=520822 RepID=A0A195BMH0_9HYME|nr:hypothetical protein ALC53_04193 [Atta colombica]